MANALGQLVNAPLIYVLTQIVFTRVPKMESKWEDFHQAIFDRYPIAIPEHIREIQIGGSKESLFSEELRWHMLDRERKEGIILNADSVVFHATSYTTSEDYFTRLEFVLSKLRDIFPNNIEVSRLGLRYIDLLLPGDGLPVDDQVAGKLGSIPLDDAGCEFVKLEEVTRYKTAENGNLVVRHRQSINPDILPGDLFPNNLTPAPLLSVQKPEDVVVGLMDFDHYVQLEFEFEMNNIIEKLKAMHVISSQAFQLATTSEAQQLWKGE
jgi:uncharacterized protein (TIGR04255 family)